MMHPLRFACTRLYTLNEGIQTNMVVELNPDSHCIEKIYPIKEREFPFTEWLGGTIILSNQPYETLSYYTSMIGLNLPINEWIDRLILNSGYTRLNQSVYACHICTTNIEADMPARLL